MKIKYDKKCNCITVAPCSVKQYRSGTAKVLRKKESYLKEKNKRCSIFFYSDIGSFAKRLSTDQAIGVA